MREHAECLYTIKKRDIPPRVLADFMEKSGKLLSELCDSCLAKTRVALMYHSAPAARIRDRFRGTLRSLAETMRASKSRRTEM